MNYRNTITKPVAFLVGFILACNVSLARDTPDIAEQLGYSSDDILLIVHSDDLGLNHSKNRASIELFEVEGAQSGSIMVPAPWFPEIAAYSLENPEVCLGLHLTLTSEWKHLRWNGVLGDNEIPSLIDEDGFLYETIDEVIENYKIEEVENELRAQVDRAIHFGINPTHLDTHMGVLHQNTELFEVVMRVGRDYQIPVRTSKPFLESNPEFREYVPDDYVIVDSRPAHTVSVPADKWDETYDEYIENFDAGLHEIVIHPGFDDKEMQATTIGKVHWYESAWRQRDFDYFSGPGFKELVEQRNIKLVTWREIQNIMYPERENPINADE